MGICRCTQRACERQGPEKTGGTPIPQPTETSTTLSKNTGRTGVSNLSKNCTCGTSTGTSSNRGTSTVVCADTTRHQSLNNNRCHQLVQELHLWDLVGLVNSSTVGTTSPKHNREVQHFVDELNRGTSKEMGSRLAQAVGDDSLAELCSSLQGLRVPFLRSALTQTTLV